MLTKLDYSKALDQILNYVREDKLFKSISAIYIGGSVARGDFIPGRSDIDLYVVLEHPDLELENALKAKVSEIAAKTLGGLVNSCGESISVSFTTNEDILQCKSWLGAGTEYHEFVTHSALLYGQDIRKHIYCPTVEEAIGYSKKAMQALMSVIMDNELPEFNQANKNYILRGVFGGAFSALHFFLSYKGIYVRGKEDMVKAFQKNFDSYTLEKSLLTKVFKQWTTYAIRDLSQEEATELIHNSKILIQNLHRLLDT